MIFLRYLRELLDLFVKWWWAALTGVASILSWLVVPDGGVTIGRLGISVTILVGMATAFLILSVVTRSFGWYVERARPEVVRCSTASGTSSCTFVIRSVGEPVHAGYLLTVFRYFNGEEVPIAVLRVEQGDLPLGDVQCSSIWVAPVHQRDIAKGAVQPRDLSIRRALPERLLEQLRGAT